MHHFLKTVLLSCALLAPEPCPPSPRSPLRCVSAAPSGTWYIALGAVGKAYTNITRNGCDHTPRRRCDQCARLASRAADEGWLKTVC